MYTNIFIDRSPYYKYEKEMICHLWDDEIGYYNFPVEQVAYEKNERGKFISIYGDKLIKRKKFLPKDPTLLESDVSLETRILIDKYVNSDEPAKNNRIVYLDIEVDTIGGFPDMETANKTITAISIYDSKTQYYTALILDTEKNIQTKKINNNTFIKAYDNEYNLLVDFKNLICEIRPTIITGWNSKQFDIPYLYKRINKICTFNITKQLSPINNVSVNKRNGTINIAGISHIDYMNLYKKFTFKIEPSYALNAIGLKVVNIGKVKYSGSLDTLYKTDINKFIEYNLNDVKIIVALEKKLKYIEQAISLCHKCHVTYESFQKSSVFIEGAILTYLRREGLISKNKPLKGYQEYNDKHTKDEAGFEGAFVKDPIPGIYEWVYDLDLQSLYPSIIRTLNISPETKRETAEGWDPEEYMKGNIKQIKVGDRIFQINDFIKYLRQKNYSIAANGIMYSLKKQGIIPQILTQWFNERVELRKLEKKYGKEGDTEKYEFYHHKQLITKVLLNSVYGVLGLSSFRFYDKDNASAITSSGQCIIKTTCRIANTFYNKLLNTKKDNVIYVDTDSAFLSALPIIIKKYKDIDLTANNEQLLAKKTIEVATEVQTFINNTYNTMAKQMFNVIDHKFYIKQELVSKSSFWVVKKRYAQLIINNGGIPCNELDVKGIDVVRSSFPICFQKFMKQFLIDVLNKVDEREINKKILKLERELKYKNIIEIAKNTSVKMISNNGDKNYNPKKREKFNFIKGTPAQVKAALFYNDLIDLFKLNKKTEKIKNGQKIKWVYLKQNEYNGEAIAIKSDDTDPAEIMDFINDNIDRRKIYERELKSKLLDFYKILNWKYPSLTDDIYNHFRN